MEREELAALGENSSSVPRTDMVTQNLQPFQFQDIRCSLLPPGALHALGPQTYMWININTHKVKINLKSEEPS